jgi:hypothetical protein
MSTLIIRITFWGTEIFSVHSDNFKSINYSTGICASTIWETTSYIYGQNWSKEVHIMLNDSLFFLLDALSSCWRGAWVAEFSSICWSKVSFSASFWIWSMVLGFESVLLGTHLPCRRSITSRSMNLTLLEISPLFWEISFIFAKYSDRSCKHISSSNCRLLWNCGHPGLILYEKTPILIQLNVLKTSKHNKYTCINDVKKQTSPKWAFKKQNRRGERMRSIFQKRHSGTVLTIFQFTILLLNHMLQKLPVSTICWQYAHLSTLLNDLCGHKCFYHKMFYLTREIKILKKEKFHRRKM